MLDISDVIIVLTILYTYECVQIHYIMGVKLLSTWLAFYIYLVNFITSLYENEPVYLLTKQFL